MPKYFALIHPQTPSDPIQTLPDTIHTPQDIGIFIQYRALEETSQELRMLSSVTINCQVTKIVINPGSQLSVL